MSWFIGILHFLGQLDIFFSDQIMNHDYAHVINIGQIITITELKKWLYDSVNESIVIIGQTQGV